ncbi:MAG TPA: hypothetical protein VIK78_22590 [Ruminiclostridium sp.]
MNKKLINLVLTAVMIFSIFPTLSAQAVSTVQVTPAAKAAPTLKIGDYIQMGKY